MTDKRGKLFEALGRWSVEICRPDAELAPPQYLLDAINAACPVESDERKRTIPEILADVGVFTRLIAERDALKAALRELVDGVDIYLHNGPFDSMKILGPAMRKARALLAAPEDAP